MGFPLWWMVRWHRSQPATYHWVSRHICFEKYWSFRRKYVWSPLKCPLQECRGAHGGFVAALPVEYTTVLCSLPFLLPPFLLPLRLSALLLRCSSLPMHSSPPVSVPNLYVTAVGYSLPNRTVVLTPTICVLCRCSVWQGGREHGLAKECAIGSNHSSSNMPALMSTIHSLAAVASSAIKLNGSRWKSGW